MLIYNIKSFFKNLQNVIDQQFFICYTACEIKRTLD